MGHERIALLEAMAGMYAALGYRRKETYVLREVLGCVLDLLVCGREEDGYYRISSPPLLTGLAIQGLTPTVNEGDKRGSVGIKQNESKEGNVSVLKLLKYICRVLGVDLDAVRLVKVDADGRPASLSNGDPTIRSIEEETPVPQDPFGWPELQVGIVREAIAVAEALPGIFLVFSFLSWF
jgi:trafficking protein particle complex subunit 9